MNIRTYHVFEEKPVRCVIQLLVSDDHETETRKVEVSETPKVHQIVADFLANLEKLKNVNA